MSDSIFIKNSIFNDRDSLSSSALLKIEGIYSPQETVNTVYTSAFVKDTVLYPIASEMISQAVINGSKKKVIEINPISFYISSNKLTTFVYEKTKRMVEENMITLNVTASHQNTDIRSNAATLYIKNKDNRINLLTYPFKSVFVKSQKAKECLVDMISVKVGEGIKKSEDGLLTFPIVSIDINNEYPMSEGPLGGASGGDLEKMVFTIQQSSFFEFRFYFRTNKVKEVRNLPNGMEFDIVKQRMFGTPVQSNRYPITIILEDDSEVQGIIEVPKLNRKL